MKRREYRKGDEEKVEERKREDGDRGGGGGYSLTQPFCRAKREVQMDGQVAGASGRQERPPMFLPLQKGQFLQAVAGKNRCHLSKTMELRSDTAPEAWKISDLGGCV